MFEKLKNFYYSLNNRVLAFFILFLILLILWGILIFKNPLKQEKNIKQNKKITKQEKKVILEKQKIKAEKIITKQEKIANLRRKLKQEKFLSFDNYELFTKKNKQKKFVYLKNKKLNKSIELLNFDSKSEVFFGEIYSNSKEIYIFIDNNLYIYNIISKDFKTISFGIIPDYIKKITNNKYIIVTQKGSFIYNGENNNIEYFYLFKDFVIYKNNYIGIIYSSEIKKKKNIGLEKYKSNILVKYNLETKEKKLILENVKGFEKIIIENSQVYIFYNFRKFILKNL